MTAAWRLSVATLRKQLPEAIELLRCCAVFSPEPIPRDVFRRGTSATNTRVSDLIADPIFLARAIRELGRFALVRIDGRTIQIHRLIQALLRDDLDLAEQESYQHEVHSAGSVPGPWRARLRAEGRPVPLPLRGPGVLPGTGRDLHRAVDEGLKPRRRHGPGCLASSRQCIAGTRYVPRGLCRHRDDAAPFRRGPRRD